MQVIKNELFATPVWEVQTDLDDDYIKNLVNEVNQYTQTVDFITEKAKTQYTYNIWNSSGQYINDFRVKCKNIIEENTKEYFQTKDNVFIFSRGWLNYHHKGVGLPVHGHGATTIVMNFYVETPENCGDLLVIDPRNDTGWDFKVDIVNGARFKRIKPIKGKLVFFPGYLLHMVENNLSDQPRISLSSNISVLFDKESANDILKTIMKNV